MKRKYSVFGSGVLLLAVMVWLLLSTATAQYAIQLHNGSSGSSMFFNYLLLGGAELLLIAPLLVYMAINGITVRAMMGNRTNVKQLALAALLGILLVPAMSGLDTLMQMLVQLLGGKIIDTSALIVPNNVWELLAGTLAIGAAAGLVEEPIFRGVALRGIAGAAGRRAALVLSALAFSMAHGDLVGAPSRFIAGLVLGMLFWRSGALLPGMITHAVFNTTSLGLALATKGWQGFRFSGVSPEIASLVTWVAVSLPFIALSWGVWKLFRRVSPQAAAWSGTAYAAGEAKPAHYAGWIVCGVLIGGLVVLNTAMMWLPEDFLNQIMDTMK